MENKKIKILEISKSEYRSEYVFPKKQVLFKIIRETLFKLGFKKNEGVIGFGRPWDQKSEKPILNKEENINGKNYNDRIIHFSNNKYSIEIIFFSKKVVLIFNYKKDQQQKISKSIGGFISDK
jgi:hypothetical protein